MSNKSHILLFMTYGMSLKEWDEMGILSREILPYKKLVEIGYEVTIISYGYNEDKKYSSNGINVIPIFSLRNKSKSKVINFLKSFFIYFSIKEVIPQYDIIKTNQMGGSWATYLFKMLDKKPLIIRCGYELLWNHYREEQKWIRKYLISMIFYILEFFSYFLADRIILSNVGAKQFIGRMFPPLFLQKVIIIRNYIDTNKFHPIKGTVESEEVLFIGRLNSIKNLDCLITNYLGRSFTLNIIGEGDQKKNISEKAIGSNIKVNFLGKIKNEQLPEIISKYKYFILPSKFENSPKALMEAMACGRIVIGNNSFGINELIIDGENGVLIDLQKSFSNKLESIFNMTHEKSRDLMINSRKYAVENFSLESILKKEEKVLEELIV